VRRYCRAQKTILGHGRRKALAVCNGDVASPCAWHCPSRLLQPSHSSRRLSSVSPHKSRLADADKLDDSIKMLSDEHRADHHDVSRNEFKSRHENRAAVILNVVGNVCKYRKSAFQDCYSPMRNEHSQLMSNDDKDSCRECNSRRLSTASELLPGLKSRSQSVPQIPGTRRFTRGGVSILGSTGPV